MYRYDEFDAEIRRRARLEQFRGQVARRLTGELTEDEFKPLRLMNGLYLQLHAYMLRIAVPYGTLLSGEAIAASSRTSRAIYDKGFGHFTTRQERSQFELAEARRRSRHLLAELASVEMHCIQTSAGNCIRNVTADQFAGARRADEIEDPRPIAEIIRRNGRRCIPNSAILPRQMVKIAVSEQRRTTVPQCSNSTTWLVEIICRRRGRDRLPRLSSAAAWAARPMSRYVVGDFVAKKDILAFLERPSCASTTRAAVATTYTKRASRSPTSMRSATGGNAPPGRARVSRKSAKAEHRNCPPRRNAPASMPISRRPQIRGADQTMRPGL